MTCTPSGTRSAIMCAAPLSECLTTNISACIATKLSIKSSRLSPLLWDEVAISKLTTSADSLFAAISKVVRVLVLFSKKRLNTDLPRNTGTFFALRVPTDKKDSAWSRISMITSRGKFSNDSKCRSVPSAFICMPLFTRQLQSS